MYDALFKILSLYWREYGGWRELLASPFLHVSALATALYSAGLLDFRWREFAIGSLPTILGLSMAAYAITFSLMGSALHRVLSKAVDERLNIALIKVVNSTFFHVLFFQLLAMLFAMISQGRGFENFLRLFNLEDTSITQLVTFGATFADNVGFFLTIYATFLLLSIGIAMFRLGRLNSTDEDGTPSVGEPANDESEFQAANAAITQTRRFKFVAWLSKRLGLYDTS